MLRRALVGLAGALLVLALGVGVEILLAMRREYLPTEPALVIEGVYGEGEPLRFVVLGDSTAAGLGTDEIGAYPTRLARRLGAEGYRVHLTSVGVSGARVVDVLREQVPAALELSPDLVFVGVGANDATHVTDLDRVGDDMERVIERLRGGGAALVIAGAPDMRAAAFHEPLRSVVGYLGRRVADRIGEAGKRHDVPVVPLAEKTAPFFAAQPDAHYASDDFHPSGLGYKRWADAIFPYLLEALR